MPIRKHKVRKSCDLQELLNWVAHDSFDGPAATAAELKARVFGDTSDLEQVEITEFNRSEAEDAARKDVIDALINSEIAATGHLSKHGVLQSDDWRETRWSDHDVDEISIPANVWKYRKIDWNDSSVRYPNGEYILVRLQVSDVLSVWKVEEETQTNATVPALKIAPEEDIPAADRYVSRSDNQATWDEATASLDEVLKEFKADHRLDNDFGPEKVAITQALEAGRQLLHDTKISVQLGVALIVEPLRRLASKYEQAIAGAVATAGIDALLSLAAKAINLFTHLLKS